MQYKRQIYLHKLCFMPEDSTMYNIYRWKHYMLWKQNLFPKNSFNIKATQTPEGRSILKIRKYFRAMLITLPLLPICWDDDRTWSFPSESGDCSDTTTITLKLPYFQKSAWKLKGKPGKNKVTTCYRQIFQEIGHLSLNSECLRWVMQASKRCHLLSDAAVQPEQLSETTSNPTICHITDPQSPLQTQRGWIWPFPAKSLLSSTQTHPAFLKCEEESLFPKPWYFLISVQLLSSNSSRPAGTRMQRDRAPNATAQWHTHTAPASSAGFAEHMLSFTAHILPGLAKQKRINTHLQSCHRKPWHTQGQLGVVSSILNQNSSLKGRGRGWKRMLKPWVIAYWLTAPIEHALKCPKITSNLTPVKPSLNGSIKN